VLLENDIGFVNGVAVPKLFEVFQYTYALIVEITPAIVRVIVVETSFIIVIGETDVIDMGYVVLPTDALLDVRIGEICSVVSIATPFMKK
jgi:hypothetical protein